jgi:hypothetical protein
MVENCIFNCGTCGSTKEVETAKDNIPECCGKPMKKAEPLEPCHLSDTAEHARLDKADEPCDDGRKGPAS